LGAWRADRLAFLLPFFQIVLMFIPTLIIMLCRCVASLCWPQQGSDQLGMLGSKASSGNLYCTDFGQYHKTDMSSEPAISH
jgi:hypothetical protein